MGLLMSFVVVVVVVVVAAADWLLLGDSTASLTSLYHCLLLGVWLCILFIVYLFFWNTTWPLNIHENTSKT